MKLKIIFGIALLSFLSCKKDKPDAEPTPTPESDQLQLNVQPTFGTENIVLDDSVYHSDPQNCDIIFTDIKFFMTRFGNGSNTMFEAQKFDYRNTQRLCFQGSGSPANFGSLAGYFGVPVDLNHNDPSAFPSTSVLNISNCGDMHWSWNPGYIFIVLEGRVDTIPDGNPVFDHFINYHIGTDDYLGSKTFPTVNWTLISDKLYSAQLQLDMQRFIDNPTQPIDVKTERFTHSGAGVEALTSKVLTNFLDAISSN